MDIFVYLLIGTVVVGILSSLLALAHSWRVRNR